MEPFPAVSSHLSQQVTIYPLPSTQIWQDPVVTIKTEPPEDSSPEVILPDRSNLNPESDREEDELLNMEKTKQHFTTKIESEENLSSEMEEPLETSLKVEEFSIKTESEEDLSVFLNKKDTEEEDESMMRIQPEITSEIGNMSHNRDKLIFHAQCFLDGERDGEDTADSMRNENTQQPGRNHNCEELTLGQNHNITVSRNEQIGRGKISDCDCQKGSGFGHQDMMHFLTYSGELAYRCGICGKQISSSICQGNSIAAQMQQGPKCSCGKAKRYECQYCGHRFNGKGTIDKHIRTVHLKEKRYECAHCGQKFGQKGGMKHHVETVHLKVKQHECEHCGLRFGQSNGLKKHVRTVHLKEKPFECPYCRQGFGEKGNMHKHIRTVHFKQKQYECQYCGQRFGLNCNMNKHVQIVHMKIKQHECQYCGQRFALNCDMNKHVQTVHMKIKQHECQHCGQRFGLKGSMVAHENCPSKEEAV